jgi:hypothetical protein
VRFSATPCDALHQNPNYCASTNLEVRQNSFEQSPAIVDVREPYYPFHSCDIGSLAKFAAIHSTPLAFYVEVQAAQLTTDVKRT